MTGLVFPRPILLFGYFQESHNTIFHVSKPFKNFFRQFKFINILDCLNKQCIQQADKIFSIHFFDLEFRQHWQILETGDRSYWPQTFYKATAGIFSRCLWAGFYLVRIFWTAAEPVAAYFVIVALQRNRKIKCIV